MKFRFLFSIFSMIARVWLDYVAWKEEMNRE